MARPSPPGLAIRATPFDDPTAQHLVADLLADLDERYGGADDAPPATGAQLGPPAGAFLLAWVDDAPVGCGGIRRVDERTAEIKRMYVAPAARGRGVARALLAALEDAARERGYAVLRLETGVNQPEAIALYTSSGYHPTEPFGYYARFPDARFYAKPL